MIHHDSECAKLHLNLDVKPTSNHKSFIQAVMVELVALQFHSSRRITLHPGHRDFVSIVHGRAQCNP